MERIIPLQIKQPANCTPIIANCSIAEVPFTQKIKLQSDILMKVRNNNIKPFLLRNRQTS
jgi:hypothetical protein